MRHIIESIRWYDGQEAAEEKRPSTSLWRILADVLDHPGAYGPIDLAGIINEVSLASLAVRPGQWDGGMPTCVSCSVDGCLHHRTLCTKPKGLAAAYECALAAPPV